MSGRGANCVCLDLTASSDVCNKAWQGCSLCLPCCQPLLIILRQRLSGILSRPAVAAHYVHFRYLFKASDAEVILLCKGLNRRAESGLGKAGID